MRKWFKYSIEFKNLKKNTIRKHSLYQDFEKSMGGYTKNKFYKNKRVFIEGFLRGRFNDYNDFLNNNLNKKKKIISIASGRCINELVLINKGFDIHCSDLGIPKSYNISKKIFQKFKFFKFNILKQHLNKRYQVALALGLIYVFSKEDLDKFFFNINKSIKIKGNLILDSSSSSNNFYTRIFDKYILKFETYFISFCLNLIGKTNVVVKRHHGYKFTNTELVRIAQQNGFKLVLKKEQDYLSELLRSNIINKIYMRIKIFKYFLILFGYPMPYLRIFKFIKVREI
tara:strand:- start:71 stop:925 length:855 start_codon:yes stop_codon:yes gene_type:complete